MSYGLRQYNSGTVAVKCKIQLVEVIVFTEATVVKTTEAAASVASNVATAMPALKNGYKSGERYSSPAGPGGARPPNTFWCNSQPKICKSVKVLPSAQSVHQHFMTFRECRFCPCCRLLQWVRAESGYQVHCR